MAEISEGGDLWRSKDAGDKKYFSGGAYLSSEIESFFERQSKNHFTGNLLKPPPKNDHFFLEGRGGTTISVSI